MFVEQFVDKGLGNSAYLVGSREAKVAALIDPLRDVDRYLARAEELGVTVTYVLETHLHADFVSGAREVAALTGAVIGASAGAELEFEHQPLVEGDRISLGDPSTGSGRALSVAVLATPGHTPEHIAFTVTEAEATAPTALFSGGSLIVGGAARTDLLGHELTEPLARQLYHTIHKKFLALPDSVEVYPTHGAGSFCAVPGVSDRTTTIGRERAQNRLAQAQTEDEFITLALSGLPSYPVYYREMRPVNRRGPRVLGGVPSLAPLSSEEVRQRQAEGSAVVDVRPAKAFGEGHISGAYGIPLDAPLVTWAGWLIPFGTPLVLVAAGPANLEEAVRQLLRIGYDDLRGYLEGGLAAWEKAGLPVERVTTVPVAELRGRVAGGEAPVVLDVRQDAEWAAGHIPGAVHIENGRLPYDDLPIPVDRPVVVYCGHRNRSMAGLSVLERRGYRAWLLDGGFAAWKEAGFEIEGGRGNGA